MKPLLVLRVLTLLAVCFSSAVAVAAPKEKAPLGTNEARVTGHKATFTNAVTILMTPADLLPKVYWKNDMIIPAGPAHLAIGYESAMPGGGGAIGAIFEHLNTVKLTFEAEAGHEYHAEMWGKTVFNMGFKITDKTTGKIVAQAKVKEQKKANKDQAKPAQ